MKPIHSALASGSVALAAAAAFTLALHGRAPAQATPTARSFDGVWKITKVVRTGANAGVDLHPQPGFAIYSRGFYSIVRDNSAGPRGQAPLPKDPAHPTDAEKAGKYDEWAPFTASMGTYELKGDTIITHNLIAKQVGGVGLAETATIRFEGDTYVATAKSADAPGGERQTTYTRVR